MLLTVKLMSYSSLRPSSGFEQGLFLHFQPWKYLKTPDKHFLHSTQWVVVTSFRSNLDTLIYSLECWSNNRGICKSGASRGFSAIAEMVTLRAPAPGVPLKRSASSDREAARNFKQNRKAVGNGIYSSEGELGNGRHNRDRFVERVARASEELSRKGKSAQVRSLNGDGSDGGFCKSSGGLYKIAILVIALFLSTFTVMQSSLMMIVKHTDFLAIPTYVSKVSDRSWILPASKELSECERAVRSAVENFTEQLGSKADMIQLWNSDRDSRRPPQLALICPNLEEVPDSLHLSTIARGLQWLGYGLELYGLQDGPLRLAWEDIGVPVHIVQDDLQNMTVDWSNFEGVLAVSLDAKKFVESLAQEPFTDIPVLWVINENIVLDQHIAWNASVELQAVYMSWLGSFNRSTVLVFPNYFLPMLYNDFYVANFLVIPGSPRDVWEAEQFMLRHSRGEVRAKAGLSSDDYVIVVVGSPCTNKNIWREHAIVMKAVANLTSSFLCKHSATLRRFRLLIFGPGNSSSSYKDALQMMAQHVGLRDDAVKHVGVDHDIHEVLWLADIVVYGSMWEELSFPPIVIQAMSLRRPVIVPDVGAISQHVVDCRSGFLFPAGDDQALGVVLWMVQSNPVLAITVALEGASLARTLLARDAVVGYSQLLEKVLDIPGEAQSRRAMLEMEQVIPQGWRWDFLSEPVRARDNWTVKDLFYLKSATDLSFIGNPLSNYLDRDDIETFVDAFNWFGEQDWSQETQGEDTDLWEQVEDETIKDRFERVGTTFEEVNKMAKKTETRVAQDKHLGIDHMGIERVAQPICIYEPYYGSGAWSFLRRDNLLYQGLSLAPFGLRPYLDDVDGASRLRLLNNSYYRDVLCEVAGFFAIANVIDRLHRNSWIGFQPWHAVGKKVALTAPGEAALLGAVSVEKHGDALYFWARLESKISQPTDEFWNTCNFVNSGNCRNVFSYTFKQMYGLPSNWTELPDLPTDGGTWAAMHCWAMPTTSFLEFVMFARMFVSALDALQYEHHHDKRLCCFEIARVEVKHCYCNFLEGLVNIWAYHSARRMIYIDPESGVMYEQHGLRQRKGKMWAKWFKGSLLQSMDEDLAEEADEDLSVQRWLWPETGEVYWGGTREKETRERFKVKVEKKRRQLERQARQSKYKQRAVGGKHRKSKFLSRSFF